MHKDKERHRQQCTALTTIDSAATLFITYNHFYYRTRNLLVKALDFLLCYTWYPRICCLEYRTSNTLPSGRTKIWLLVPRPKTTTSATFTRLAVAWDCVQQAMPISSYLKLWPSDRSGTIIAQVHPDATTLLACNKAAVTSREFYCCHLYAHTPKLNSRWPPVPRERSVRMYVSIAPVFF
jgi:hypothetical protein